MCRKIIVLLILIFSVAAAHAENIRSARIVGGETVTDSRYPWMVSVHRYLERANGYLPSCGGSLISDRWILTAGHCVVDPQTRVLQSAENFAVLLGALNVIDDEGSFISVSRVVLHPQYDDNRLTNDVALLELSTSYSGQPVSLPATQSPVVMVGEIATVAGWGVTTEDGPASSDLLEVQVEIVGQNSCFPIWKDELSESAMVCAGGRFADKDACQGDSGGPLFVPRGDESVQVGIVSFGSGCGVDGLPAIYTRVSTYQSWISSIVPNINLFRGSSARVAASPEFFETVQANTRVSRYIPDKGRSDVFEVSFANRFNLNSLNGGDVDLYVYNSKNFNQSSLVCRSLNAGSFDSCELSGVGPFYVQVYAYRPTSYTLELSDSSGAGFTNFEESSLTLNTVDSGLVSAQGSVIYKVPGGLTLRLISEVGNADLYVYSGSEFYHDTLLCQSTQTFGDDVCSNRNGGQVYAMVYGTQSARYTITVDDTVIASDPTVQPQSGGNAGDPTSSGGGAFGRPGVLLVILVSFYLRRQRPRQRGASVASVNNS